MSRILFVSGSIGLGHVTRDLAIARELRRLRPDVEIDWVAASPAKEYLLERDERVLPEAEQMADMTRAAEAAAVGGSLDLSGWAFGIRKQWALSGRLCQSLMESGRYDLFLGDESHDVAMQLVGAKTTPGYPAFVLFDFLGLDAMTRNPFEHLIVLGFNWVWGTKPKGRYQPVFLGEAEDIPLRSFRPFGSSRRKWAERHALIVGHVLDFDPATCSDETKRQELKDHLGYGTDPIVLVSVGGTAVGAELVELCLAAFPLARRAVQGLRMRIVCGPRLKMPPGSSLPDGLDMVGFVPSLWQHFAACDLAIIQAGGTSTLELTALNRPFLYFPIANHCEQLMHVVPRQRRLRAGVALSLQKTSAEDPAEHIRANVGRPVDYEEVPMTGAGEVARHVVAALG